MILKPLTVAENIVSAASTVDDSVLVSVVNTHTAPVIINVGDNTAYIAAGERVVIEKSTSDTIQAPGAGAAVWATGVAYKG